MSKLKGCIAGHDASRLKNFIFCAQCERYKEYKDCKQYRTLNQRFRVWIEEEPNSL